MIQSISVRNFLSHQNTKVEFSPGLNVLIGESKAGKSALIQAIRWTVYNRPGGDMIRSNWGGTTSVTLKVDNNRIQRIKSNKINEYRLNTNQPLQSFKSGVPEQISQVLNMGEVNISSSLRQQFDPHFLLSWTPGDVAKHYNRIAHLDQFDTSRKNITSWIDSIKKDKKSQETEKEQLEENLKKYETLPEIEEKIENLEKKEKKVEKLNQDLENLAEIIEIIESVQKEIKEKSQIIKVEKKVNQLISLVDEQNKLGDQTGELYDVIETIESMQKEIKEINAIISDEKRIDHLIGLIEERDRIEQNMDDLEDFVENIQETEKDRKYWEDKLKENKENFHQVAPEICPLCGGSGKLKNK